MNKSALRILELAIDLKSKGIDVFVHYMPHINQLEVAIYEKSWEKNDNEFERYDLYLKDSMFYKNDIELKNCISRLEDLLND